MLKSNKGVTLVALVITIIVLLILAGVSISLVVGDNGVLNNATSAVDSTNYGTAKEAIELACSSVQSDYFAAYIDDQSIDFTDAWYPYDTDTSTAGSYDGYEAVIDYLSDTDGIDAANLDTTNEKIYVLYSGVTYVADCELNSSGTGLISSNFDVDSSDTLDGYSTFCVDGASI